MPSGTQPLPDRCAAAPALSADQGGSARYLLPWRRWMKVSWPNRIGQSRLRPTVVGGFRLNIGALHHDE